MGWQARIARTPGATGGRPRIKGARIAVSLILEFMSSGSSAAEILACHPELRADDARACRRHAGESPEPPQSRNDGSGQAQLTNAEQLRVRDYAIVGGTG